VTKTGSFYFQNDTEYNDFISTYVAALFNLAAE